MIYVVVRVFAGIAHLLYGALEWLARQLFADTSEDEFLVRQAAVWGITKIAPTYATGTASVTGTDGTVIPALTVVSRSDGAEYTVNADVTIAAGVGTLALTALVAGSLGTLGVGVVLAFESPITGVSANATVTASTTDGADQETTEALRIRFLEHLATPAHGGTDADYIAWAKEIAGVTRVWVTALGLGPGTVVVRFVRDGDVDPIPSAGEVAVVQAHLDVEKPAHATVTVVAPVLAPVAFTIAVVPNTVAVKAAVTAELTDLISREGAPGITLLLSSIRTAIGTASGVTDYTLTVPAANVTFTTNQLPSLGTITWV
jgi:uncharacterized phage protein gp47/JayE